MPYACSYEVPADEQLYRKVMSEIGPDTPEGLVVHLVVESEGGLRHFGVWDSQADWERFRDERVEPAVGKVLTAAGFSQLPPRPVVEELAVVDIVIGATAAVLSR
jgi:hypothetical protein